MSNQKITMHPITEGVLDSTVDLYPKTSADQVVGLSESLSSKQDTLVSGTNVKTINGASILGSGNLSVPAATAIEMTFASIEALKAATLQDIYSAIGENPTSVAFVVTGVGITNTAYWHIWHDGDSGEGFSYGITVPQPYTNEVCYFFQYGIYNLNATLGSTVLDSNGYLDLDHKFLTYATTADVSAAVAVKQDTLVSGTNIKTINGNSILGSGNLSISGGGASTAIELTYQSASALKAVTLQQLYNQIGENPTFVTFTIDNASGYDYNMGAYWHFWTDEAGQGISYEVIWPDYENEVLRTKLEYAQGVDMSTTLGDAVLNVPGTEFGSWKFHTILNDSALNFDDDSIIIDSVSGEIKVSEHWLYGRTIQAPYIAAYSWFQPQPVELEDAFPDTFPSAIQAAFAQLIGKEIDGDVKYYEDLGESDAVKMSTGSAIQFGLSDIMIPLFREEGVYLRTLHSNECVVAIGAEQFNSLAGTTVFDPSLHPYIAIYWKLKEESGGGGGSGGGSTVMKEIVVSGGGTIDYLTDIHFILLQDDLDALLTLLSTAAGTEITEDNISTVWASADVGLRSYALVQAAMMAQKSPVAQSYSEVVNDFETFYIGEKMPVFPSVGSGGGTPFYRLSIANSHLNPDNNNESSYGGDVYNPDGSALAIREYTLPIGGGGSSAPTELPVYEISSSWNDKEYQESQSSSTYSSYKMSVAGTEHDLLETAAKMAEESGVAAPQSISEISSLLDTMIESFQLIEGFARALGFYSSCLQNPNLTVYYYGGHFFINNDTPVDWEMISPIINVDEALSNVNIEYISTTSRQTDFTSLIGGGGGGGSVDASLIDESIEIVLTASDFDLAGATSSRVNFSSAGEAKVAPFFAKASSSLANDSLGVMMFEYSIADLTSIVPVNYVSGSSTLSVYENFQINSPGGGLYLSTTAIRASDNDTTGFIQVICAALGAGLSLNIRLDFYKKSIHVSGGGGSGGTITIPGQKMYVLDFDLASYETYSAGGAVVSPARHYRLSFYEANFEKVRQSINATAQAMGWDVTIADFASLTSLINQLCVAPSSSTDGNAVIRVLLVGTLVSLADHAIYVVKHNDIDFYRPMACASLLGAFYRETVIPSDNTSVTFFIDNNDEPYILDVDGSATYTTVEGPSTTIEGGGSGGGSGPVSKLYVMHFGMSTSYNDEPVSAEQIYELTFTDVGFERLKAELNELAQSLGLSGRITDFDSLVAIVNGIDGTTDSMNSLFFDLLFAKYNEKAVVLPQNYGSLSGVYAELVNCNIYGITSVSNTNTYLTNFTYLASGGDEVPCEFSIDTLATYVTYEVAGGGSGGGGEPVAIKPEIYSFELTSADSGGFAAPLYFYMTSPAFDVLKAVLNQMASANIQTVEDLVSFFNGSQVKGVLLPYIQTASVSCSFDGMPINSIEILDQSTAAGDTGDLVCYYTNKNVAMTTACQASAIDGLTLSVSYVQQTVSGGGGGSSGPVDFDADKGIYRIMATAELSNDSKDKAIIGYIAGDSLLAFYDLLAQQQSRPQAGSVKEAVTYLLSWINDSSNTAAVKIVYAAILTECCFAKAIASESSYDAISLGLMQSPVQEIYENDASEPYTINYRAYKDSAETVFFALGDVTSATVTIDSLTSGTVNAGGGSGGSSEPVEYDIKRVFFEFNTYPGTPGGSNESYGLVEFALVGREEDIVQCVNAGSNTNYANLEEVASGIDSEIKGMQQQYSMTWAQVAYYLETTFFQASSATPFITSTVRYMPSAQGDGTAGEGTNLDVSLDDGWNDKEIVDSTTLGGMSGLQYVGYVTELTSATITLPASGGSGGGTQPAADATDKWLRIELWSAERGVPMFYLKYRISRASDLAAFLASVNDALEAYGLSVTESTFNSVISTVLSNADAQTKASFLLSLVDGFASLATPYNVRAVDTSTFISNAPIAVCLDPSDPVCTLVLGSSTADLLSLDLREITLSDVYEYVTPGADAQSNVGYTEDEE